MENAFRAGPSRRAATSVLIAGVVVSGCAWDLHSRPTREAEPLVLPTMLVRSPSPAAGWTVARRFEAEGLGFTLTHADSDGREDARIRVAEVDGALPLESRAQERAENAAHAAILAGDPKAEVVDLPLVADPKFGPGAVELALRATESEGSAGTRARRVGWLFTLAFVSATAQPRTCVVTYEARSGGTAAPFPAEERWRELLSGIQLRPADPASVREAAARGDDYPKQMEGGLARRSLTLPRGAFQWALWRKRWVAPGGFHGGWGLGYGITDRLQLETPGFLRYSFGEPAALTRAEYAIGAGWTGFAHDAVAGSTWGFGVSAQARRRLGADVAARGALLAEWTHESRTRADGFGGAAVAGLVWDVHPWVSLGFEAGHARRRWGNASAEDRELTWLGGRQTPLVTVHFPPLDLGLDAAVAWEGGVPGILAGFSLRLTL